MASFYEELHRSGAGLIEFEQDIVSGLDVPSDILFPKWQELNEEVDRRLAQHGPRSVRRIDFSLTPVSHVVGILLGVTNLTDFAGLVDHAILRTRAARLIQEARSAPVPPTADIFSVAPRRAQIFKSVDVKVIDALSSVAVSYALESTRLQHPDWFHGEHGWDLYAKSVFTRQAFAIADFGPIARRRSTTVSGHRLAVLGVEQTPPK